MVNIMKNVMKILTRRKSFIITSFILPISLIFLFTLLYSENSSVNIGVINKDGGKLSEVIESELEDFKGIKIKQLEVDDDYEEKLLFKEIQMVITIEDGFTEKLTRGDNGSIQISSISQGDVEPILTSYLEANIQSLAKLCNNIQINDDNIDDVIKTFKENKPAFNEQVYEINNNNIINSVGIIVYLVFIVAGFSCSFLLEDSVGRTKDRTLMGNVSEKEYYLGLGIVFTFLTSIPIIVYYISNEVMGAEFGFENHLLLLGLMLILAILAVSFNIMLSSIIKKKDVLSIVNSALVTPVFMLSGTFWRFELMGSKLQSIGNLMPIRWFMIAIENLQLGKSVTSIIPMVLGMLVVSICFFALSIFFTKSKIVIVKEI